MKKAKVVAPEAPETPVERDLSQERENRVIPAAKELLRVILTREDLVMGIGGAKNIDKTALYYQGVYIEDVVPVLVKHNLKLTDLTYLFSVMLGTIELVKNITDQSFSMNREIAEAKLWGIEDTDDLTVADLEKVLKTAIVNDTNVDNADTTA